jgi:hypothetical protein
VTPVVVGGVLANKAGSGGEAWVRLSWVRGLQRLGLDVWFVEELATHDENAVAYFQSVTERFHLQGRSALLAGNEALVGPCLQDLVDLASSATLVNISGHLRHPGLFPSFRRRVLVDIDPGFTQFWYVQGISAAGVEGHDQHFTIAENIGAPDCSIPSGGIDWRTVRQPVVLDDWPVVEARAGDRFTTIANWRGPFGPIEHDGKTYGLKVHEFRKFIELPRRTSHHFELALSIDPADDRDLRALRENGWNITDPRAAGVEPETFRTYVQASGAEFSVAQGMYVDTNSGWFSDRTTRYLASGRPALLQDTGFSRFLRAGEGLIGFRTLSEAVAGADRIVAEHPAHCEAARLVAERHFDSDRVLARFCDEAGIAR